MKGDGNSVVPGSGGGGGGGRGRKTAGGKCSSNASGGGAVAVAGSSSGGGGGRTCAAFALPDDGVWVPAAWLQCWVRGEEEEVPTFKIVNRCCIFDGTDKARGRGKAAALEVDIIDDGVGGGTAATTTTVAAAGASSAGASAGQDPDVIDMAGSDDDQSERPAATKRRKPIRDRTRDAAVEVVDSDGGEVTCAEGPAGCNSAAGTTVDVTDDGEALDAAGGGQSTADSGSPPVLQTVFSLPFSYSALLCKHTPPGINLNHVDRFKRLSTAAYTYVGTVCVWGGVTSLS